jgi:hypothetical protein
VSFLDTQKRVPATAPLAGILNFDFLFKVSQLARGPVGSLIELRVGIWVIKWAELGGVC